jgi:pimeloyl-ACP methyl ester carboxylesterase
MNWSPEDVANMYKNRQSPQYRLGNIPLIVLTRGEGGFVGRADSAELETERLDLQKKLSQLSTNSKWIVDKKSGHNIHLEDPDLVIRSVKEVVEAVRAKRKLK